MEAELLAAQGGTTILLQGTCCIIAPSGPQLLIKGEGWRTECCREMSTGPGEVGEVEIGEPVAVGIVIMWADVENRDIELACASPYGGLQI